jgi:hypothetical protein
MKLARYTDYRSLFREESHAFKQKFGSEKSLSRLADYCGVQKTYLSAVLGHRAHFSRDQLFLACDFLRLSESEKSYVEQLYELPRAPGRAPFLNVS